ncbi:hypothetical protein BROUX41_001853 [Berkeleyomyces rouxiae]
MLLPGVDASLGVLTQRIQAVRSVATRVEDALRTSRPDAENTAETELFESFSEEVIRILHSKAMDPRERTARQTHQRTRKEETEWPA